MFGLARTPLPLERIVSCCESTLRPEVVAAPVSFGAFVGCDCVDLACAGRA